MSIYRQTKDVERALSSVSFQNKFEELLKEINFSMGRVSQSEENIAIVKTNLVGQDDENIKVEFYVGVRMLED